MSSTPPDWPAGLPFGPGDVAILADIAAGQITRQHDELPPFSGLPDLYIDHAGQPVGAFVRRLAERGFIAEDDRGNPTLTERGARIVADYGPLARAHLDWQWRRR